MYELTKRVVFHLLVSKGEAGFNDTAEILLRGMPELTGVVPVSGRDELLEEFKLAVLAVWSLCPSKTTVDTENHIVKISEVCRKRIQAELGKMRQEATPRLLQRYVDAVESILY